jgi:hypothetical protein
MSDKIKSYEFGEMEINEAAFSQLRGRQSVRATFKLTDSCIEAISIVAAQLGIKQKSLFDHLLQDTDTLSAIASRFRNVRLQPDNRVQKTYVISRGALVSLEDIAKNFNTPRDALIELSVQRLLPIIEKEREHHAQRKAVYARIRKHLEAGRKILHEAETLLGEQDPLTDRLGSAMGVYANAFKHMTAFISKNEGIEEFEPDAYTKVDIIFE